VSVEPELRSAEDADLEGVLDLWRAAETAPSVTDDLGALERLIVRDPDALVVAVRDTRIVGTVVATWDGWRGQMYRLAVHPDERRLGVARALVAEGERRLRDHGCRRITALVLDGEEHATAFWLAAGYLPQPEIGRFYKNLDG
jgi:ribosomal protein S18 acetylase RimI-like enzyme